MNFAEKTVLVIGCAKGLGRGVALGCARAGAEVLLADHDPEGRGLLAELGGRGQFTTVDVADPAGLRRALTELVGERRLDGLIYLPRARNRRPLEETTVAEWDQDLDISLRGVFLAVQAVLPALKRSPAGFVLTLSSILSDSIGLEGVGYHVAKAGLDQLTRYLAVELGPHRIRANAIQLGWMVKDEQKQHFYSAENATYRTGVERMHPLRTVGNTSDLMNAVLFLGSDAARFITGQILRLDGGLTLQEHSHLVHTQLRAQTGEAK